jgi:hypothetical protein
MVLTASETRPGLLDDIISDIADDLRSRVKEGITSSAALIPDMLQDNMIDEGTRGKGGQNRWARLTRRSIRFRKTYPLTGSLEEQERYFRSHIPLRDTNTLFNSFKVTSVKEEKDGLTVAIVTSTTNYGWRHEFGVGTTPDGQPIWYRPHMYIVEGLDTARIDRGFEGLFK